MRYYFDKPDFYLGRYGKLYVCNHPLYNQCTLYKIGDQGLAVIQQRFDPELKVTSWDKIDPWLIDSIYLNPEFQTLFQERAQAGKDGLYPTMAVRQVMWALKMKPIPKQPWETVFDRKYI